jgi:hypothetical protein
MLSLLDQGHYPNCLCVRNQMPNPSIQPQIKVRFTSEEKLLPRLVRALLRLPNPRLLLDLLLKQEPLP